jgi:hypothetical protein
LKDGLGENRSGSLDGLAAGYYRIILELSYYDAAANLTKRAEKSQVVHIYPGMETDMNETFGADAFSDTKTFTTLEAIAAYLDAAAPNSRAEPYYLELKGFDLSTDFMSLGGDPLGKLFNVLNRRFVTLDFSACTGDFADASSAVNRSYLVALVLPPTVSRIGNNLFYNAERLGSVLWLESPPDAVIGSYAFQNCSSLVQMSLPPALKTISPYAFDGCSKLASLDLPGTLESVGTYAFRNCTSLEAFNWPNAPEGAILGQYAFSGSRSLRSVILPPSLTSIGVETFADCKSLESINLPQSLTGIGNRAFQNCISLTMADVPPGIMGQNLGIAAFTGCTSLRSATLPEGLTWLYTDTFKDAALETITIPSTLETINGTPFVGCIRLRFVVAEGNVRYSTALDGMLLLDQYSGNLSVLAAPGASGNITIPGGVTRITSNAFQNNIFLTGISLPDTLTAIGDYAFDGCSALRRITIPPSVTSLGSTYTFRNCTALEEFDWPTGAGTPTMGSYTFQGCVSLRSATLPEGLTTIASSGFNGCISLESITIPASVTTIPAAAFQNCISLESIDIPAGVTTIAANAFQGCSSLGSVTLPGGLVVINTNTFQGCTSLRWVKWPVSGNNAYIASTNSFGGCTALEKFELPDKLRTASAAIPANAFLNLSKLKTVVIHTSAVAGLGNVNAFSGTSENLAIYVPDASVAAYQAGTNWSGLSSKIAEISTLTDDPAGW